MFPGRWRCTLGAGGGPSGVRYAGCGLRACCGTGHDDRLLRTGRLAQKADDPSDGQGADHRDKQGAGVLGVRGSDCARNPLRLVDPDVGNPRKRCRIGIADLALDIVRWPGISPWPGAAAGRGKTGVVSQSPRSGWRKLPPASATSAAISDSRIAASAGCEEFTPFSAPLSAGWDCAWRGSSYSIVQVPSRPLVLSIRPHPMACRRLDWLNPVTPQQPSQTMRGQ